MKNPQRKKNKKTKVNKEQSSTHCLIFHKAIRLYSKLNPSLYPQAYQFLLDLLDSLPIEHQIWILGKIDKNGNKVLQLAFQNSKQTSEIFLHYLMKQEHNAVYLKLLNDSPSYDRCLPLFNLAYSHPEQLVLYIKFLEKKERQEQIKPLSPLLHKKYYFGETALSIMIQALPGDADPKKHDIQLNHIKKGLKYLKRYLSENDFFSFFNTCFSS